MTKPSYIQADNIAKSYKDVQALKDMTFEVGKGELFGFIGPDGAGKSTLFRILTTLLLPDRGMARVNGMDVVKDYKAIRNITGYMPGRFSLYHDLSVEENLSFFARVFGVKIEDHYELIKDIYSQIAPFKNRKAGALSGGMKQKLALSCALIHKPGFLVLDEPTTGVDAVSRKEFWEMLQNLKKQGITIVVSTPYMDEAGMCDRVGLMNKGRLLMINTTENIISAYDKSLFAIKSNNNYRTLQQLKKYNKAYMVYMSGQTVHLAIADPDIKTADIKKDLGKDVSIKQAKPDIEDCFMNLMMQE
jgi:ABC-type multidrug transport system ATPase subunit